MRNQITKNEVEMVKMRLCPSSIVRVILKKVNKKKGSQGRPRLLLYCTAHHLQYFRIGNRVEPSSGLMTRRRSGRWRIKKMIIVDDKLNAETIRN